MANQVFGKALSDIPALKPYRGKLAVRNFRGGDGNVGIIRSPVRAIALPDYEKGVAIRSAPESCAVTARDTAKRRRDRWGVYSSEKMQSGRRRFCNARKAT